MTSKVSQIGTILRGAHVMGDTPENNLKAYHAAKACVNAMRMVGRERQLAAIKRATKNYRVMLSATETGVRFFRPETKTEVILPWL